MVHGTGAPTIEFIFKSESPPSLEEVYTSPSAPPQKKKRDKTRTPPDEETLKIPQAYTTKINT